MRRFELMAVISSLRENVKSDKIIFICNAYSRIINRVRLFISLLTSFMVYNKVAKLHGFTWYFENTLIVECDKKVKMSLSLID